MEDAGGVGKGLRRVVAREVVVSAVTARGLPLRGIIVQKEAAAVGRGASIAAARTRLVRVQPPRENLRILPPSFLT